jgi:hypothetical protein
VIDLSPGAAQPTEATVALAGLVANGPWAAGVAISGVASQPPTPVQESLQVVDWRTGTVALTVPLAATDLTAPEATVLTVAPDGTVVYTVSGDSTNTVWTASPAAPTPRAVIEATSAGDVRSADGRVAVRTPSVRVPSVALVHVYDLDGNLLGTDREPAASDAWQFNGTQLAYVSRPCAVSRIVVRELDDPPATAPSGPCPAPTIASAAAEQRVNPVYTRIRLQLTCIDTRAVGCRGIVRLTASGFGALGDAGFTMSPGRRERLWIDVSRKGSVWLAHHSGARVVARSIGEFPVGIKGPVDTHTTRLHLPSRRRPGQALPCAICS